MQVNTSDFDTVFNEIDVDKSGLADIEEVMAFVQLNSSKVSKIAQAAILNMRGHERLQPNDLREIFSKMPANFASSFMFDLHKKGCNRPSENFRLAFDSENMGQFKDIAYVKDLSLNPTKSSLDKTTFLLEFLALITFELATGVK